MSGVLVVAGEASGDRAAAAVARRLVLRGVPVFGMGGEASDRAGVELVSRLEDATAAGFGEVARRAVCIARARKNVLHAAKARKPTAALLVDYTEFNASIAAMLRRAGTRVLWYVAPQIWAWRAGRASSIARRIDRMAVVLPFEEDLWRKHGVDARYVGHPCLESPELPRSEARESLGLTPTAPAVAILPGSRPHEVRALLPAMLAAYEAVRHDRASLDARLLLAPSLDPETSGHARELARRARIPVVRVDATTGAVPLLSAFDAALCASGTASLEAALAGAIPIVLYRVGLATEAIVRPLLRTPHVALPNVLLGRRAFTELLQRDATVANVVRALDHALGRDRAALHSACSALRPLLGRDRVASEQVAAMLNPWV